MSTSDDDGFEGESPEASPGEGQEPGDAPSEGAGPTGATDAEDEGAPWSE